MRSPQKLRSLHHLKMTRDKRCSDPDYAVDYEEPGYQPSGGM